MRAFVLCAGYGTRLGELTRDVPKPMLDLGGRPLLEYVLSHLRRHGYHEIGVNLHFRPDLIRGYFGDGSRLGVRLTYFYEPRLLGTAGALHNAGSFLESGGSFLVYYGDILTDQDLSAMRESHLGRGGLLTLLIHRRRGSNSVVKVDEEHRIVGFLERPPAGARARAASDWVNSGVCVCDRALLELIPPPPSDLAADVLTRLAGREGVYAYPLEGYRCAIDSPERYREAQAALAEGRCRIDLPA